MSPQVRLETTGAIATVTIDRPEKHHAISYEMSLKRVGRSPAEVAQVLERT